MILLTITNYEREISASEEFYSILSPSMLNAKNSIIIGHSTQKRINNQKRIRVKFVYISDRPTQSIPNLNDELHLLFGFLFLAL